MSSSEETRLDQQRLVFLSHAGVDTEAARVLKARLLAAPDAAGIDIWFDKDDLLAGQPWQEQIEAALSRAAAFVVYVGSRGVINWVEAEVRLALDRAITDRTFRFVPVLAAGSDGPEDVPPFARLYQCVFDVENRPDEFGKLMAALLGRDDAGTLRLEDRPFFGLQAIDESRSHLFFGRETETEDLVNKVAASLDFHGPQFP